MQRKLEETLQLGNRLTWRLRCGIDAEYFPATGISSVSDLSEADEELLIALRELADEGLFESILP